MKPPETERRIHDLVVRIDRTLCVGFGDCVGEGATAFVLDEDGIAVFATPEAVSREALLKACESCPVDALTVFDDDGRCLVPS
ncbi:MAG: ferredoxin [Gemmatimonadetes bacterium]|nr:ferredoxin [Gemmatimonadota bacterium]